jgi:hypothetical protein
MVQLGPVGQMHQIVKSIGSGLTGDMASFGGREFTNNYNKWVSFI